MSSAITRCFGGEKAWRTASALAVAGVVSTPLFGRENEAGSQGWLQPFLGQHGLFEKRREQRLFDLMRDRQLLHCGFPFRCSLAECKELVYESNFTAEMKEKVARIDFTGLLSRSEVFNIASDEVIQKLMKECTPVVAKEGTLLFSQGDLVDKFYIVGEGCLKIEHDGKIADKVPAGGATGEVAVVHKRLARGTARVSSPSAHMMVLSHEQFHSVMSQYPEELRKMKTAATERVLLFSSYDFFSKVQIFADCSDAFRFSFCQSLMYVLIPDGVDIFSMGKEDDDGMFFIKSGKVGVYDEKGLVASLGAGDFFGEGALFGGPNKKTRRNKTVRALGFVEAFQLTCEDFHAVQAEYPKELEKMSDISKFRSAQQSSTKQKP
mmetsp:Transcript_146454/g.280826  ORF Transcript_146454/g.280826 Transcript_146454/m.280826 type:complete len:379 (-) Transcript_146454:101-1237(-)